MKTASPGSKLQQHQSTWRLIRVKVSDEPARDYEVDSAGRLINKMPRQKKRILTRALKQPAFPKPIPETFEPVHESSVDWLWEQAGGPEPMPIDFLTGDPALFGDFECFPIYQ
jgi:hypothetical protein